VSSARAVLITLGILMVGYGLLASLIGVRGTEEFSAAVMGLAGSVHYAGFLGGAFVIPLLISNVGHIRVYGAIASGAAVIVLVFPYSLNVATWVSIRFVLGLCLAGMYIVAESWLNSIATNETRGRLLSLYLVTVNLALGGGQYLLSLTGSAGVFPFVVGSAIISLSVIPLSLTKAPSPSLPARVVSPPIRLVLSKAPLGPVTSVASGLGVGIALGMGPIYGVEAGLSVDQIATMMGVAMVAGVVLQWPIGALSDRFPRRTIILATAALAGGLSLTGLLFDPGTVGSYLALGMFTATSFPLYSLAISHVNDVIPENMQVSAAGVMTMAYGIGSVTGPAVAGLVFSITGPNSYWVLLSGSTGVLAVYVVYRLIRRPVLANRAGFRPLPPEPSPAPTLLRDETQTQGSEHR
jgi:MFS family permease